MAQTLVNISGTVTSGPTQPLFLLQGTVINRGDIPDDGLFLKEIMATPAADLLARVCTIADFEVYTTDRDWAKRQGNSYFRSRSFSKTFDDLEVAAAAKTALFDTINTLVTAYQDISDVFKQTIEGSFPSSTDTEVQQLITAYEDAVVARQEAEADIPLKQEALTTASDAADTVSSTITDYTTLVSNLSTLYAEMSGADAAVLAFKTVVGTGTGLTDPELTAYQTLSTYYTTIVAGTVYHLDRLNYYMGQLGSKQAAYNASLAALNLARKNYEESLGAAQAARTAEELALSTVRGICPNFDPLTGETT